MASQTSQTNGRLWGARARDWAEVQEGQCAAAYHAVLAHAGVGPGTRHLDVGCGAGMAAGLSASLGATVAGIDAAETLLEIARERTPGGDFRQGDLEALPFEDDAFDLVTGFNAFQFAGDAAQALREAARVTRPGGMIVVMSWGEPAGMEAASLVAALKPLLPAPPPGAPGPFALSDEAALRAFAVAGGLTPGAVFDVDTQWFYPDEATALRGLGSSGVAIRAVEHSGEDAFVLAHRAALAPFRQPDGSFRLGARFRCLVAAPLKESDQMTLPAFFDAMPALDLPFPETVVSSHAIRSEAGLVVFFRFHQDCLIPPHSHGPQWGTVIEGEVALTIDGATRRCRPGESYDIPAGVVHTVQVKAGTIAVDVFAEPDRYPLKGRHG